MEQLANKNKTKSNGDDNKEEDDDDEFIIIDAMGNGYFRLKERYYNNEWNWANLWVVQGKDMDLIVDTGIGLWDFAAFLKQRGLIGSSNNNKPYLAVATHIHFDHSGGLHQFPGNFAIHQEEANAITKGDNYEMVSFLTKQEVGKLPSQDWTPNDYAVPATQPSRILQDGDILDLGGGDDKIFKVLHMPGHSRGSICLWNEATGTLFSGDVVYDGELIDFAPFSSIPDYVKTFEKLIELSPKVKRVLPGHGEIFDGSKMNEIATTYLEGLGMCHSCHVNITKVLAGALLRVRNANACCRGPVSSIVYAIND